METLVNLALGGITATSALLTLWQWLEGRLFPLHRRVEDPSFAPAVTLFKPLKGSDPGLESCLESWFAQDYPGPIQYLFGAAAPDDPALPLVRRLLEARPGADAHVVVCPRRLGPNAKASTLAQLESHARHGLWVISDADVWAPPDLLVNLVAPLRDPAVGLVNPLYAFTRTQAASQPPGLSSALAMGLEAVAVNADFWTSVLQARRLRRLRFALGAAIAVRHTCIQRIGGLATLVEHLADDYVLGRRIADTGQRIELCPTPVACLEEPRPWRTVWQHQLRWARTIRVCSPGPYAASLISNPTLWPALWALLEPNAASFAALLGCLGVRILTAADNERRLMRRRLPDPWILAAPVKDLLQVLLWSSAFLGNTVEWRQERFRVQPDGRLVLLPDPRKPDASAS
ncbi:MAG TPA: glycosyltransferase [Verrucomicrobiota bacterium]|nr:glycosyltransferase [Verrucomicrobiota bacterium]HNU50820.1 glycosyltransferase [Verrucomicrobiota bacterium]